MLLRGEKARLFSDAKEGKGMRREAHVRVGVAALLRLAATLGGSLDEKDEVLA